MPEVPFWGDPRLQEISEEARQWLDAPEGTSPPENVRRAAGLTRARATAPANVAELLASYARTGGAARPTGLVPASIQPQAPSSIPLEEFADYESMQESTQRGIQPGDVFDEYVGLDFKLATRSFQDATSFFHLAIACLTVEGSSYPDVPLNEISK